MVVGLRPAAAVAPPTHSLPASNKCHARCRLYASADSRPLTSFRAFSMSEKVRKKPRRQEPYTICRAHAALMPVYNVMNPDSAMMLRATPMGETRAPDFVPSPISCSRVFT